MKNTMKIVALFFALAFTTAASAQGKHNDNALIGKARGAAHECLTEGLNNSELNASIETLGICFVSGQIKRVTLYGMPKCTSDFCIMMVRIVATVDFDCDGNIIAVNCGGLPTM